MDSAATDESARQKERKKQEILKFKKGKNIFVYENYKFAILFDGQSQMGQKGLPWNRVLAWCPTNVAAIAPTTTSTPLSTCLQCCKP